MRSAFNENQNVWIRYQLAHSGFSFESGGCYRDMLARKGSVGRAAAALSRTFKKISVQGGCVSDVQNHAGWVKAPSVDRGVTVSAGASLPPAPDAGFRSSHVGSIAGVQNRRRCCPKQAIIPLVGGDHLLGQASAKATVPQYRRQGERRKDKASATRRRAPWAWGDVKRRARFPAPSIANARSPISCNAPLW